MTREHVPQRQSLPLPQRICAPLRYILGVSEGYPEDAPRVDAYVLWLTLGSPGPSYSEWIEGAAPEGVDPQAPGPVVLTWRQALLITTTTNNKTGGRARQTFSKYPEVGQAVMLRLLGLQAT